MMLAVGGVGVLLFAVICAIARLTDKPTIGPGGYPRPKVTGEGERPTTPRPSWPARNAAPRRRGA